MAKSEINRNPGKVGNISPGSRNIGLGSSTNTEGQIWAGVPRSSRVDAIKPTDPLNAKPKGVGAGHDIVGNKPTTPAIMTPKTEKTFPTATSDKAPIVVNSSDIKTPKDKHDSKTATPVDNGIAKQVNDEPTTDVKKLHRADKGVTDAVAAQAKPIEGDTSKTAVATVGVTDAVAASEKVAKISPISQPKITKELVENPARKIFTEPSEAGLYKKIEPKQTVSVFGASQPKSLVKPDGTVKASKHVEPKGPSFDALVKGDKTTLPTVPASKTPLSAFGAAALPIAANPQIADGIVSLFHNPFFLIGGAATSYAVGQVYLDPVLKRNIRKIEERIEDGTKSARHARGSTREWIADTSIPIAEILKPVGERVSTLYEKAAPKVSGLFDKKPLSESDKLKLLDKYRKLYGSKIPHISPYMRTLQGTGLLTAGGISALIEGKSGQGIPLPVTGLLVGTVGVTELSMGVKEIKEGRGNNRILNYNPAVENDHIRAGSIYASLAAATVGLWAKTDIEPPPGVTSAVLVGSGAKILWDVTLPARMANVTRRINKDDNLKNKITAQGNQVVTSLKEVITELNGNPTPERANNLQKAQEKLIAKLDQLIEKGYKGSDENQVPKRHFVKGQQGNKTIWVPNGPWVNGS